MSVMITPNFPVNGFLKMTEFILANRLFEIEHVSTSLCSDIRFKVKAGERRDREEDSCVHVLDYTHSIVHSDRRRMRSKCKSERV